MCQRERDLAVLICNYKLVVVLSLTQQATAIAISKTTGNGQIKASTSGRLRVYFVVAAFTERLISHKLVTSLLPGFLLDTSDWLDGTSL